MISTPSPQPVSWFVAQKRPFILANIAALALLATALFAGDELSLTFSRLIWPGLLYYFTFILSLLTPLWLVQATVYLQMRRHGHPIFVAPGAVASLDPPRACRFLLYLHPRVFLLSALYLHAEVDERKWVRPAWLYLALFATALLGFCLWTTSVPDLPPLFLLAAMTFWFSALIFGLSHLVQGH